MYCLVVSNKEWALLVFFFHKPTFALLDECTHMVAAAAEEGLYRTLFKDFNITLLTLTQRLFLADIHHSELRLGMRTSDGWALAAIGGAGK